MYVMWDWIQYVFNLNYTTVAYIGIEKIRCDVIFAVHTVIHQTGVTAERENSRPIKSNH